MATCPLEGQVVDRVTPKVYKPKTVKYTPLGLLSIAANIPDHYEVIIIDASSFCLTVEQLLEQIETLQPDILGLSVVTYRAWAMREILTRTSVPIKVVGGPHATYHAETVLKQGADAVFKGDAEATFPLWLQRGMPSGVFAGDPVDLNKIPFPDRQRIDLAAYSIQVDKRKNLLFDAGRLRLPMFSSKGCPLKCIYCDVQQKNYNAKSPETILKEFKVLKNLGASSIHILDDTFNIEKRRVIQFSQLLQNAELKIDWSARGAVEGRETVIKALTDAGCQRFHVGIEHLDDRVLHYFRKAQRYKDVVRFCKLCDRYNLMLLAYFILGAPGETDLYRQRLPDLIRGLGIKLPFFNVLTPLSETAYYQDLLKRGVFKRDFWQDFIENPVRDFQIPSHRSEEEEQMLADTLTHYLSLSFV
ncbi:B12-binding domain-containing radical SAM protein [Magnetococcales bacterium HHB-1]